MGTPVTAARSEPNERTREHHYRHHHYHDHCFHGSVVTRLRAFPIHCFGPAPGGHPENSMSITTRQTIAESVEYFSRNYPASISGIWFEAAACRNEDLEIFFAVDGREEKAKEICQRCPVRWECLTYAIETRQRHGVWGGLTADERGLLVRKLREP